jgi:hypothetical protein
MIKVYAEVNHRIGETGAPDKAASLIVESLKDKKTLG